MMGTKARIFAPIAVVSLEELVPLNHFYRHLDRVLDLSFVRELVAVPLVLFRPVLQLKNSQPPVTYLMLSDIPHRSHRD